MRNFLIVVFLFFSFSFYGQNDTLSVVRHTDNDPVVPKDLKVVYRGILNELFIDVPDSKSFTVFGNGITKESSNIYKINPQSGNEVIVTVDIVLKNNKKVTEKHVYSIKKIGSLVSTINGKSGLVRMQKAHFKDAKIKVIFEDKNLSFLSNVTAFSLKIPGLPSIVVTGNKIDQRAYESILNKASIGDQIVISDIKLFVTDKAWKGATCFLHGPIVIEIY